MNLRGRKVFVCWLFVLQHQRRPLRFHPNVSCDYAYGRAFERRSRRYGCSEFTSLAECRAGNVKSVSKAIGATPRRSDLHYSYSWPRTRRNGWFAFSSAGCGYRRAMYRGCTGPGPIVLKRHTLQHVLFVPRGKPGAQGRPADFHAVRRRFCRITM